MNTEPVRSIISRFGLSQEELGAKLGVGQTTVSAWVRNNRIPAWRLADLLDLAKEQGVEVSAEEIVRLSRRPNGNRTEGRLMPAVLRARGR